MILLKYNRYSESKKIILENMSNLNIEIQFTGKMGIKTKF